MIRRLLFVVVLVALAFSPGDSGAQSGGGSDDPHGNGTDCQSHVVCVFDNSEYGIMDCFTFATCSNEV